jgi:hypothetical protein
MKNRAKVVVSHVSGERMKDQGTDGISRGQLKEGVLCAGKDMLSYIPFHLDAIKRSPDVELWLRSSWLGPSTEILTLLVGSRGVMIFWEENTTRRPSGDITSNRVSLSGVHRQPPLKLLWRSSGMLESSVKILSTFLSALG